MKSSIYPQSLIDSFIKKFNCVNKKKTCVIKINGNVVKMHSGKSAWGCRAHAVAALKNQIDGFQGEVAKVVNLPDYSRQSKVELDKFLEYLEQVGILEYVEFEA